MEQNHKSEEVVCGGGELTIAAMDENSYREIGRKTYIFVRKMMQDPEIRKKVKERLASRNSTGRQDPAEP